MRATGRRDRTTCLCAWSCACNGGYRRTVDWRPIREETPTERNPSEMADSAVLGTVMSANASAIADDHSGRPGHIGHAPGRDAPPPTIVTRADRNGAVP